MINSLIISIASHPPRFSMLKPALVALLEQECKADSVVLWLSPEEVLKIPTDIARLPGLTIKTCENLRSYKKLVPALSTYPGAHILTADDDKVYPPSWSNSFVKEHRGNDEILIMRGKRITTCPQGLPVPYERWEKATPGETSPGLFPTSCRGMLVPPGVLGAEFFDMERARSLAPNNDDIWWYWMALRAGLRFRVISGSKIGNLPTYRDGLFQNFNRGGGNDRQIVAMAHEFGWPI